MSIANDKTDGNTGQNALPCLYSNNSIETASDRLSTQHKKSATSLAWNVQYMAEKHGLNNIGFLTLTFPFKVYCMKEAQKLFNSLSTNYLRQHYAHWICVKERHKDSSIHFHLLVVCSGDIRTGFRFEDISDPDWRKHDYSSANALLKRLWSMNRRHMGKYKFGRAELLPIKSTSEGIARYVGKYISKTVCNRLEQDKGTRMVNYSGDSRIASTRFTVLSEGSAQWRKKVKLFCKLMMEIRQDIHFLDQHNISQVLGKHWCYHWREFILNLPDQP
jgi:hypothetical protein